MASLKIAFSCVSVTRSSVLVAHPSLQDQPNEPRNGNTYPLYYYKACEGRKVLPKVGLPLTPHPPKELSGGHAPECRQGSHETVFSLCFSISLSLSLSLFLSDSMCLSFSLSFSSSFPFNIVLIDYLINQCWARTIPRTTLHQFALAPRSGPPSAASLSATLYRLASNTDHSSQLAA